MHHTVLRVARVPLRLVSIGSSSRSESGDPQEVHLSRFRRIDFSRRGISFVFGQNSIRDDFFFFFPHFRRSSLKSLHRIWCRDFLFFFFFWFEILLGISGTRQPPFESKDTRCFFVFLFFFFAVRCE